MKINKKYYPYFFLGSILICNIFYFVLNHFNNDRTIYSLVLDFDKKVPFIPAFIIPYMIYMPFLIFMLVYMCMKDRKKYYVTLIALNITLYICYIVYVFFQTTVPRPPVKVNDLFTLFVKIMYFFDQPYNCFPSIHVAATYLVSRSLLTVKDIKVKHKLIISITSFLIIISTQFVKQHVILDLIVGLILSEVVYTIVTYISEVERSWKNKTTYLKIKKKVMDGENKEVTEQ